MKRDKSSPIIKYSFLKILTGSDLSKRRLAVMQTISKNEGPVVWLTAAVHGDEVGGIVIIQEIFKRLKKKPLLRGKIFAFPLMNPIGFESAARSIPLSEEDLNRVFPGNPNGSLAERIASIIFNEIFKTNPTLVLDLHNDWFNSIPYTLIDPHPGEQYKDAYEKAVEFAHQSGFLVVYEEESQSHEYLKKTLSGSLINLGIPSLSLELGEAYVVNEKNVQLGVASIWKILTSLSMVEPVNEVLDYHVPYNLKNFVFKYSNKPVSSTSGIIRFLVKPGNIVKKGQPVARITNVFGKLKETIKAPTDGVILGVTDSSVAFPGIPVVAFGNIYNK